MDKFIENINLRYNVLREKDLVEDPTDFLKLCITGTRTVRKLNKILNDAAIKSFDIAKIRKVNADYKLGLNFSPGGKVLVDRSNVMTILKILDDDFLRSPVTRKKYETHSKVLK
jgi:hypothetical protein